MELTPTVTKKNLLFKPTSLQTRSGKSPISCSTTGRESPSPKLVEIKEESFFVAEAESSFTSW